MGNISPQTTAGRSYAQLVERNWGFLSQEQQSRIADTRVLFAGCGLGSNVALLAARTGFTQFTLYDGDCVERSNLNRQAFRTEHTALNKAVATASLITEINPGAQVQAVPRFLTAADADAVVQQCDVVVNMVDPGPALHALCAAAKTQGKPLLFPMNVGFGGLLLAFGPESPSLMELLGPGGQDDEGDLFIRLLLQLAPALPPYLQQYLWVAEQVQQQQVPPPQLGVAASQTSSLLVTAMVKIASGYSVPCVPSVLFSDAWAPSMGAWPETGRPQSQEITS